MAMTEAPRRLELRTAPWGLIAALGAFALLRPVLSIVGAYAAGPLEKPTGPLLVTALTIVVWAATVLVRRTPRPVQVLALAGAAYGVFATALNLALQPFLEGAELVPVHGAIAMTAFNAAQGAVVGLIVLGIRRLRSGPGR